jgi:DNA-binding NarL/FixJ family response regulator
MTPGAGTTAEEPGSAGITAQDQGPGLSVQIALTLAVVDDELTFRQGLEAWLGQKQPQARLTGSAASVPALLQQLRQPPQVVILDVRLPGPASLSANLQQLNTWGCAPVVVTGEEDNLEMIRVSLDHDALAFVHKGDGFEEIWQAACFAANGDLYPNSTVARYWRSHHPRLALTDKQIQVLQWFIGGMQIREVAQRMFVTEETVRSHLRAIRDKCAKAGLLAETREDLRTLGITYGITGDWRA